MGTGCESTSQWVRKSFACSRGAPAALDRSADGLASTGNKKELLDQLAGLVGDLARKINDSRQARLGNTKATVLECQLRSRQCGWRAQTLDLRGTRSHAVAPDRYDPARRYTTPVQTQPPPGPASMTRALPALRSPGRTGWKPSHARRSSSSARYHHVVAAWTAHHPGATIPRTSTTSRRIVSQVGN